MAAIIIQTPREWKATAVRLVSGWHKRDAIMEAVANYFAIDPEPRLPFATELLDSPRRSKYFAVFVATWTLTASALLVYALEYALLQCRLRCLMKENWCLDAVQFFIFVVPFQICVLDYPTAGYARFVLAFNLTCCLLCFVCCLHRRLFSTKAAEFAATSPADDLQLPMRDRWPYNKCMVALRAIVYITTAVCIFARDQPCWNNDFSKAYTFGTGVMDIGLGCFVLCIGSLGPTAAKPKADVNRCRAMKKASAQFFMLSVCGLVKSIAAAIVIAIKDVHFENSWREYGVHWNAFYTLAVAKLAGTALELYLLPAAVPPLLAALAAGVGHEAVLSVGGVAHYVLAPGSPEPHNRTGLLGANREGVCSTVGLAALYLVGLQLGRWTNAWSRRRRLTGANSGLGRLAARLAVLLVCCLGYRILLTLLPRLLLPESRRLLNLSYCAWVSAFVAFCLLNACLVFAIWPALFSSGGALQQQQLPASGNLQVPLHLRRVDSAGLLYFLVSNLLTGLANLLIDRAFPDRESTDGPLCFLLVLLYMLAVYPTAMLAQRLVNLRALYSRLTACCC